MNPESRDPQRPKLAFLPEAHTDFVFVFVPERGLLVILLGIAGAILALVWCFRRRERVR